MAPSLCQRQRPPSSLSLRSCVETGSSSPQHPSDSPTVDEELAVRTVASSMHSVTSSSTQQRKTSTRGLSSSGFSVSSSRSTKSFTSSRIRKRDESYSPTSKPEQILLNHADKRFTLYIRIAVLMFILLNLTNFPFSLNHQDMAKTQAMTIYTQAAITKSKPDPRAHHTGRKPRFLFGIFSTLQSHDSIRRDVIRRTYLGSDRDRICSLKELPSKPSCQIVYTFVVGANETGATDLVANTPPNLTIDPAVTPLLDEHETPIIAEDDVTYLNIKENMEYGKSPSWFLMANTLADDLEVDFIAKVDSDTLVFPDRFLDEFAAFLPTKRHKSHQNTTNQQNQTASTSELRVYGGIPIDVIDCGGLRRPHCAQMNGKTYMQGQLHFLSVDLSRYVTSIPPAFRRELFVPIEDLCTANYVHSHPKPVLEAVVSPQQNLWEHGKHMKDPKSYEERWNQVAKKKHQVASEMAN